MSDQFMQVEVRATVHDLASGERNEVMFEEECHELNDRAWGDHVMKLGDRVVARASRLMDAIESDRVKTP